MIDIRGLRDTWDDQLLMVEGLRKTGGVKDAHVDEATGNYVVDFDPRRVSREGLRIRIKEIGREHQLPVDPIFEDR